MVTCALVSILFTHMQIESGNRQWWWRSFFNTGSTGIYVFLYSIVHYQSLEATTTTSRNIYHGYMGFVSFCVFLMTGSIGFLSSLWFTNLLFTHLGHSPDVEAEDTDDTLELIETEASSQRSVNTIRRLLVS